MSLPSGYKRLEYIQSSGTQYIDTGFLVSSNNYNKIKFIVDCDIIGKGSGASDWLINGSNINNAYLYVGEYQNKYYYGCGTTDHNTNTSVVSGRHIFTLDTKNKKFSVSDVLEVSTTTESVTATANLYLCGFAYTSQRSFAQKLYGSKIYQDDILVRDFIPCKNSSGVVGMWDDVNSVFYGNAGTGSFVAGAEVKGSHKTLIDGTAYVVKGGRDLIEGTSYAMKQGKMLIDGTVYKIVFTRTVTITITGDGGGGRELTSVTIDGVKYIRTATVETLTGTEIICYAANGGWDYGKIYLNGTVVASGSSHGGASYTYIVKSDMEIKIQTDMRFTGSIYLTTK